MSARHVALLLALALLLACVWFFVLDTGGTTPGETTPQPTKEDSTVEPESATDAKTDAPERKTVDANAPKPDAPSATTGNLTVDVTWHDGKPAPNIAVELRLTPKGLPWQTVDEVVTDAQGIARFTGVTPGKVSLRTDRRHDYKTVKATIVAGQTVTAKIQLKEGLEVRGLVVDGAGRAVPGANIWMTRGMSRNWLGGRIVTTADTQGAFVVRDVPPGRSFGAIHKDFAPSTLVDLDDADTGQRPVRFELKLTKLGGAVEGTVTDPDGEPVVGAVVCLGKMPKRFQQRRIDSHKEAWTPLVTRTDTSGRYAFPGVKPGEQPIAIRERRFAIHRATLTVGERNTTTHDVRLTAGFVVEGVVQDKHGKPRAGVVRAFDHAFDETFIASGQFDYEDVFDYPSIKTGPDGAFRIERLTPGKRIFYATGDKRPRLGSTLVRTRAEITGNDGETKTWNPVLDPGHTIRGTVTYRDGKPMGMHFITLRSNKTGKQVVNTSSEKGEFRFINLEPAHYSISVQFWDAPKGTKPLEKTNVWPDGGEVKLVASYDAPKKLKKATVRGRIQDDANLLTHPSSLRVLLQNRNSWRTQKAPKDGVFEFTGVTPERRKITVMSGDRVIHIGEWFELAPGEERDVGTIVTRPGGTLVIHVKHDAGMEETQPKLYLRPPDCIQSTSLFLDRRDTIEVTRMFPAKYRVSAYAKGMVRIRDEVEVTAGGRTEITLHLRRGVQVPLEVVFPADKEHGFIHFKVAHASGETRWEYKEQRVAAISNPYKVKLTLAPGRYTLTAATGAGYAAKREFEVTDQKNAPSIKVTMQK